MPIRPVGDGAGLTGGLRLGFSVERLSGAAGQDGSGSCAPARIG